MEKRIYFNLSLPNPLQQERALEQYPSLYAESLFENFSVLPKLATKTVLILSEVDEIYVTACK